MAQLTQAQWLSKLKSFVPSWVFEIDNNSETIFSGMAAILAQLDQDAADHIAQTFLLQSTAPALDASGDERACARMTGESDFLFARRIQQITSKTDAADIKAAVDLILSNPGCLIKESPQDNPYCSRANYCNRDEYLTAFWNNFFTLILPLQIHAPYAFASRGYYASRGDSIGTLDGSSVIYATVVALVSSMKALGVMYRIEQSTRVVL